jgi:predicted GNAT family acetyltransferase
MLPGWARIGYHWRMTSWDFAHAIWNRHAEPLRTLGLDIERVDEPAYWATYEPMRGDHFPPEVFFRLSKLRTDEASSMQKRIEETRGGDPLRDFFIARTNGEVVAMFSGEDRGGGLYRMWHTIVHTAHRRRGIYRAILATTIGYTRELGFDMIGSEHAPCNNAVLIAKLSAGFRIVSLEIDAALGASIILRYYHHPDHLAAYELRCGHAALTPGLRSVGFGSYEQLRAQFVAE